LASGLALPSLAAGFVASFLQALRKQKQDTKTMIRSIEHTIS